MIHSLSALTCNFTSQTTAPLIRVTVLDYLEKLKVRIPFSDVVGKTVGTKVHITLSNVECMVKSRYEMPNWDVAPT